MKKIIGRILIVIIPVMLQIAWYVMLFGVIDRGLNGYRGDILTIVFTVLAVLFVLSLITRREESSYKLLWVLTIVALPILGAMLYLMLGNKKTGTRLKKRLNKASGELLEKSFLEEEKRGQTETDEIIQKIDKDDLRLGQTLKQLAESTGFPIVPNDTSKYYPLAKICTRTCWRILRKRRNMSLLNTSSFSRESSGIPLSTSSNSRPERA